MRFSQLKEYIESGNTQAFSQALQKAPNDPVFTTRDKEFECSLLDWAAIYDRIEIVESLIAQFPSLLNPAKNLRTPLHYAARHGSEKSLKKLLENIPSLECTDHNNCTALNLAVQHQHANCVRLLVNHGAQLPDRSKELTQLARLVNPLALTLYYQPKGTFQFLTDIEVALLQTELGIQTLLTPKHTFSAKPFSLKITKENLDLNLCHLIDKFLYFCKKIPKEKREKLLSGNDPKFVARATQMQKQRKSLLQCIQILVSVVPNHPLEAANISTVSQAQNGLSSYLLQREREQQRYFGDDLSDNSDSEEEALYQAKKLEKATKTKALISTSLFKGKTRLHTNRKAGMGDKLTKLTQDIKAKKKTTLITNVRNISTTTLTNKLPERATISYPEKPESQRVSAFITRFNQAKPEEQDTLLKECTFPVFVLGTRGNNYMSDRWNADSRRYHQIIDERQQPQLTEAVLKTLPYDYYTELSPTQDYHHNESEALALEIEAMRLRQFLVSLNQSGPCVDQSRTQNEPYFFNSVGDCIQDHFSNGVNAHLENIAALRDNYPDYWGKHLRNAFNPNLAIGSRPYHALRYAIGLKDYYPDSMLPRYWNDGTLEYPHVGKVYVSLHELSEILSPEGPHNVSQQDKQARIALKDLVSPEKELSFTSFLPGDRVFDQFIVKYPSFKGKYKSIYEIKYGLDQTTYEAFQYLIQITEIESDARREVIKLLAEWLCSFHEVLLIEKGRQECLKRGGILVYYDRDGKLTLTAETGRLFSKGEAHLEQRNLVHTQRELRIQLAQRLTKFSKDIKSIPAFILYSLQKVQTLLSQLKTDAPFILSTLGKIKYSTEMEALGVKNKAALKARIKSIGEAALETTQAQLLAPAQTLCPAYEVQLRYLKNPSHLYRRNASIIEECFSGHSRYRCDGSSTSTCERLSC